MAVVLALVILGWLGAFAIAAREGFENEPTRPIPPIAKTQTKRQPAPSDSIRNTQIRSTQIRSTQIRTAQVRVDA